MSARPRVLSRCSRIAALTCIMFALSAAGAVSSSQKANSILGVTGVERGLCVVLGSRTGELESQLHNGQQILVHALAHDRAAEARTRELFIQKGLYGLLSSQEPLTWEQLPYPTNSVNCLVTEHWSAIQKKGVSLAEIERVLVPGGKAWLGDDKASLDVGALARTHASSGTLSSLKRLDGQTVLFVKAMDPNLGIWSYWFQGPDGNNIGNDKAFQPPNNIKWKATHSQVHETKHDQQNWGFRSEAGRTYYSYVNWPQYPNSTGRNAEFVARDGFNGAHLWTKPMTAHKWRNNMIAYGGNVYGALKIEGPLVEIDGATGTIKREYAACAWPSTTKLNDRCFNVIAYGDYLINTQDRDIFVMSRSTGELKWHTSFGSGDFIWSPVMDTLTNRLFLVVAGSVGGGARWRFVDKSTRKVICLDIAAKKTLWTNTSLAGHSIGQIFYSRGILGLFCTGAILGGEGGTDALKRDALVGAMDAATGVTKWLDTYSVEYNQFGFTGSLVDTEVQVMGTGVYRRDAQTGKRLPWWYGVGISGRCAGPTISANYYAIGLVHYVKRDGSFDRINQQVKRSQCSVPMSIAFGQIHFTPNGCGCIGPQIDGFVSLSHDASSTNNWTTKEDKGSQILRSEGEVTVKNPIPLPNPAYACDTCVSTHVLRRIRKISTAAGDHLDPSSPIISDWQGVTRNGPVMAKITATRSSTQIVIEKYAFSIDPHGHRIDVTSADGAATLLTGGRIVLAPVVKGTRAFVGCRDGYLYCFDLTTGEEVWRFLAAPQDRRFLVNSQLESSAPVTSVGFVENELVIEAGLSASLGSGVLRYGIDPENATVLWKKQVLNESGSRELPGDEAMGYPQEQYSFPGQTGAQLPGAAPVAKVTIYDLSGRAVAHIPARELTSRATSLARGPRGMYFVKDQNAKSRTLLIMGGR